MKIQIYSSEYPEPFAPLYFGTLLGKMPLAIRQRVERFRRWQDAYGCLFGKILLAGALEDAGISADLSRLRYTPYGRPYIPEAPDFSISHSGNRVVL